MTIKLLFIGITMGLGGTEKALLSLLEGLDPQRFEISLLLCEHTGDLWDSIPSSVKLLPPMKNGILFTISKSNALSVWKHLSFHGKSTFFLRHPKVFSNALCGKCGAGERLFLTLMQEAILPFEKEFPNRRYDAVLAFSGDRTMFYLCDCIREGKKLAWLHFDYRYPPRDDTVYRQYFERCDAVISVSHACTRLLREHFGDSVTKFLTLYNRLPCEQIRMAADKDAVFPDPDYQGIRLLSVMRICHQKGYDRIPETLRCLREYGYDLRWYLIGTGDPPTIRRLLRLAREQGVADALILLGSKTNPYPYFRAADLLVLPSRYEGMAITIEEAKLLRLPYVTTRHLSAYEQQTEDAYGLLCRGDPQSIADGIRLLLEDERGRLRYRALPPPIICDNTSEKLYEIVNKL